ncbi:MAG: hypothetical protein ACC657_02840 [Thiohalomonadales bacterium]
MVQFIVNIFYYPANTRVQLYLKQALMMFLLVMPVQSVNAVAIGKNFDHFETNFILNGAHQRAKCASCHRRGLFKGTPFNCIGCHSATSNIAVSKLPNTHIKSNESCDNCHTENRWTGARVDHASISGSCFTCHNGRTATGKNLRHVASSNTCDDCHRTAAWRPARFTHDNITQPCSNCHNGAKARGKSGSHIQTTGACDACHSTRGWRPAKFVHDNIVANCNRCHNGSTATGKSGTHIQTTAGCEVCHKTRGWKPASFSHDGVTGSCSNCHNGRTATGTNSGHFVTSAQCNDCHTTRGWKPARYSHRGNYPDHGPRLRCLNCHKSNSQTIPWRDQGLSPDCAGCHRNKYVPKKHKNLSVVALKDCAGTCHKPKPEHSARDSGWD